VVVLPSVVVALVEPPLPPALLSADVVSVAALPVVLVPPTVALLLVLALAEEVDRLLEVDPPVVTLVPLPAPVVVASAVPPRFSLPGEASEHAAVVATARTPKPCSASLRFRVSGAAGSAVRSARVVMKPSGKASAVPPVQHARNASAHVGFHQTLTNDLTLFSHDITQSTREGARWP